MTIASGAPAIITKLSAQLQACASWSAASLGSNVWYPEAPEGTAGPYAVLGFDTQRFTKYADGAAPIRAGTLFFTIWKAATVAELETLAQAVLIDLMTQDTGIPFREADGARATALGDARIAGGETLLGVSAQLEHGLTP